MPKSRSRSTTKDVIINARDTDADRAPGAPNDPTANHHQDSEHSPPDLSPSIHSDRASNHHTGDASHPHSESASNSHSERAADMHLGLELNQRGKPAKCHFVGSHLFSFSRIIQCACLVIFFAFKSHVECTANSTSERTSTFPFRFWR